MSKRDEFVEAMKRQLDEMNVQIDQLEAKLKAEQEKIGAKYDEQMEQLKASSLAVKKKIDEIKAAGDERWEALVVEGEKIQKALVHSFNYFKSQLK
jgi:LPS O-antigen subunit length determinant protein (WzzB/FepE family)